MPSPSVHSLACTFTQLADQLRQQQYVTRWPAYCHACHGAGYVDDSDPSVGLYGAMRCPRCEFHCPRCATPTDYRFEEGISPCPRCGAALPERYDPPTTDDDLVDALIPNPLFIASSQVAPAATMDYGPCACIEALYAREECIA